MSSGRTILHYPTLAARRADLVVHVVGLALAVTGAVVLLNVASGATAGTLAAVAVYAGGLVLMLAFSLAYNLSDERHRGLYRHLDRSGIVLMIAGSYTPFTATVLSGWWAWTMTGAIWGMATVGIIGRLALPRLGDTLWIAFCLAMGWLAVFAAEPMIHSLSTPALTLLVLGGFVYTIGVIFHVNEQLEYSRSIWHGHVVAAACVHWAAILIGAVLPVVR